MYIYTDSYGFAVFYTWCLNLNKLVISENNDKFLVSKKKKKGRKREENKGYFLVLSLILFITFSKVKFNLYANKLLLLLQKCHVSYNFKNAIINYKSMSKKVLLHM